MARFTRLSFWTEASLDQVEECLAALDGQAGFPRVAEGAVCWSVHRDDSEWTCLEFDARTLGGLEWSWQAVEELSVKFPDLESQALESRYEFARQQHARRTGNKPVEKRADAAQKGHGNPYTDDQIDQIRRWHEEGLKDREIAERLSLIRGPIEPSAVKMLRHRKGIE